MALNDSPNMRLAAEAPPTVYPAPFLPVMRQPPRKYDDLAGSRVACGIANVLDAVGDATYAGLSPGS